MHLVSSVAHLVLIWCHQASSGVNIYVSHVFELLFEFLGSGTLQRDGHNIATSQHQVSSGNHLMSSDNHLVSSVVSSGIIWLSLTPRDDNVITSDDHQI